MNIPETAKRYLGRQVGHYRLTRWLGQGGFADIYLGEHLYLKTQCAIKMLHVQLSEKALQNFLHEAQFIAGLDHPNIVRVFDYGIEGGNPYLVMNYAPNGSIRRLVPQGTRLPPERLLSIVQQLASALDYAHQRKLIHRDVKPENMLVGQQEHLLLSDFGLAVVAHSNSLQTAYKAAGTVSYAAPEQIQGRAAFASDQYALGIVTYEWICGERPFKGTFVEIASQHLLVPPPSLCHKVLAIAPPVEQVIFRALAKDPAQRYKNVTAFANALRDAYQQTTHGSRPVAISIAQPVPEEQAAIPPGIPQSDPAANQLSQEEIAPHSDAPVSAPLLQVASASTTLQTTSRQTAKRPGALWQIVLLVLLSVLILAGGGIWYTTAHFPEHGPGPRQFTSSSTGASPLASTVPGTTPQGTRNATPAGTGTGIAPGKAPVPTTGTAAIPTRTTGTPTQVSQPTPTAAPDCLRGSSSHLTFTSLLGLGNPSPRLLTLTNCGGSAQNWTTSIETNGGGNWLSANPTAGMIATNGNENVQIQSAGNGLQIGIYKGSIVFLKGSSTWTVTVTYTIVQA